MRLSRIGIALFPALMLSSCSQKVEHTTVDLNSKSVYEAVTPGQQYKLVKREGLRGSHTIIYKQNSDSEIFREVKHNPEPTLLPPGYMDTANLKDAGSNLVSVQHKILHVQQLMGHFFTFSGTTQNEWAFTQGNWQALQKCEPVTLEFTESGDQLSSESGAKAAERVLKEALALANFNFTLNKFESTTLDPVQKSIVKGDCNSLQIETADNKLTIVGNISKR